MLDITLIDILLFVYFVMAGAVLGRIDGGGLIDSPNWLERGLIVSFFVLACVPFAGWYAILAFLSFLVVGTGHGQYFLDLKIEPPSREKVDFIVSWFFGDDPRATEKYEYYHDRWSVAPKSLRQELETEVSEYGYKKLYWRSVFGMGLTGLLVGIAPAVVAFSFGEVVAGLIFLLTGPVKAAAYVIGYKYFKGSLTGEYINGAGRNVICAAVFLSNLKRICLG